MSPQLNTLRNRPGILRVVLLALSILGGIFAAIDIVLLTSGAVDGYEVISMILFALATYCYSIAWSISAICVLLFHGAYPPGVDIGLDFLGWALGWGFAITLWVWAEYNSYGTRPMGRAVIAMDVLAGVMAFAYGAIHLYFFDQGVRKEIKRRRLARVKRFGSLQDGSGEQLSENV